MSNDITTILTMTGPQEEVDQFCAAHIVPLADASGNFFDLRTVVPRPACVEGTQSGSEADEGFFALTGLLHQTFLGIPGINPAHQRAQRGEFKPSGMLATVKGFAEWLAEHHPQSLEEGRKSLVCFRETGYRNWYDWSYANWGTKWNAYDFKERERATGKIEIQFDTANGVAEPVFVELTRRYPQSKFDVVAIDEGGPEYVGTYTKNQAELRKVGHDPARYKFVYGRDPEAEE